MKWNIYISLDRMFLVSFNWMTSVFVRHNKNTVINLVPAKQTPLIITFDDENQGKEARKKKEG